MALRRLLLRPWACGRSEHHRVGRGRARGTVLRNSVSELNHCRAATSESNPLLLLRRDSSTFGQNTVVISSTHRPVNRLV